MRLAHIHSRAARSKVTGDKPWTTAGQDGSYFPNSRVAAGGTSFVSPVTYAAMGGPAAGVPNEIVGLPRGGESPWIVPVPSDEQGVGRSPGQQWPWQVHSEAYNLSQIDIMPFEFDQTFVTGFPDARTGQDWIGRERPERVGWSWPRYYEQYEGYATDPDSLGVLPDPLQQSYQDAWGIVGGAGYGYE